MSLGGGFSTTLNNAVANSIAAGVTYSISAGNSNADACNASPTSTPTAITVGSTTSSDARSSFSNFGTCVDIFAPGSIITSAWYTSDTVLNIISGTSMSAPHVAGVAAHYLEENPGMSPAQVQADIESAAVSGLFGNPGSGSPNLLLQSLKSGEPPPPASLSVSVSGQKVRGRHTNTVSWSGNDSAVDIYRDGALIASGVGGNSYVDNTGNRGGGSYTYDVCDSDECASGSVSY